VKIKVTIKRTDPRELLKKFPKRQKEAKRGR
jgi:hypothetical protein